MKLKLILPLLTCAATLARAGDVFVETNARPVAAISTNVLTVNQGELYRYEGTYVDALGAPVSLDYTTISWVFTDTRGVEVEAFVATGTIVNAAAGRFRLTVGPNIPLDDGQYEAKAKLYHAATTAYVDTVAWNLVNVESPASSGAVSLSSTTIVNVTTAPGPTGIAGTNTSAATTGTVFITIEPSWTQAVEKVGNVITLKAGLPDGAPGVIQYAQWNGSKWDVLTAGSPTSPPTVGTNVAKFSTVYPTTNTWVAPPGITGFWARAWGATGGGYGTPSGGHIGAYVPCVPGEIFEIIVGNGGNGTTGAGGAPGGGNGSGNGSSGMGGGGAVFVRKGIATTNYVLVAGSSAGSTGSATASGGPGGGYIRYAQDGTGGNATNVSPGGGAWADDWFGSNASNGVPGTATNNLADGSFLQGGNAFTNRATGSAQHAGGGAGWQGGAGTFQWLPGNAPTVTGGGGLAYANPAYCSWVYVIRGIRSGASSVGTLQPPGTEYPSYTTGRGVGSPSGSGNGTAGCVGFEY